MQPHQETVTEEKEALDEKIESLNEFLNGTDGETSETRRNLDLLEVDRMQRQLDAMNGYSRVLAERLEAYYAADDEDDSDSDA